NRNRRFASRNGSATPIPSAECHQLGNMADEAQRRRKLPLAATENEPLSVRPATEVEQSLLADIARLGGEDRLKGAEGALEMFQSALSQLVRENPKLYGAGEDAASQSRVVAQLAKSVRIPFLVRTAAEVRQKAGYVLVCGYCVHRAVFTFV